MTIEADAGEAGPETEAQASPTKGRRKLIFIAAGAVAVLAVGGAGAAFLMLPGGGDEQLVAAGPAYFYDLPQITVNLSGAGEGAAEQFLRLSISLELPDEASRALIEPRMPLVLDAFTVYLRELRRSDLEGSAGVYRLKEELRRRVNLAIHPAQVNNILFQEMLVQ